MTKYLFFFFLAFTGIANAQTPNWAWARSGQQDSATIAEGWNIATDPSGNICETGFFTGPYIIFGNDTLFNGLSNVSASALFLVKHDAMGNVLWVQGGEALSYGQGVATDKNGNIYVTGNFQIDSITFGNFTLYNSSPSSDVFVVKYNSSGNVIWAKTAGGTSSDQSTNIAVDKFGNAFVTGSFCSPTMNFGTTTITNSNPPYRETFVAKYDPSGNVLWVKNSIGSNDEYAESITTDGSGNSYITGNFDSPSVAFGSYTLSGGKFFLSKYDSLGNVLWAKNVVGQAYGQAVISDSIGNAYVTGYFDDTITFGNYNLIDAGVSDIFLAKYDSSGTIVWVKSAGGIGADRGWNIAADSLGNLFIAAEFLSVTMPFASTTLTAPAGNCAPPYGCDQACILKYDTAGNELCAFALASGGDDNLGIAIDKFSNVYLGGDFKASPFILGTDSLPLTSTSEDIFISKCTFKCDVNDVNEFNNESTISIFPNPSSSGINVETDKMFTDATVTLYNSLGQTVKQVKNISGQTFFVDRENLPSGLYFICVTQNNIILATEKLVITDK
jgi:hypothetical protein